MADVLPFPRARTRSGSNDAAEAPPAGRMAAILLFTGVRYERHADSGLENSGSDDLGRDDDSPRRRKSRRRA